MLKRGEKRRKTDVSLSGDRLFFFFSRADSVRCAAAVEVNGKSGIIMGNSLYFTVDDSTREKYEKAGMNPFSYVTKKGRIFVRSYFELPEDVLNDAESLRLWAIESIIIADKKKKPTRSRRQKV